LRQAAAQGLGHEEANEIPQMYWEPCRRYIAWRFRLSWEEAQDLTQGFFAMLLDQPLLERYDPARGPFRPYLRACLDQFVFKQQDRARAQKRGGAAVVVPITENVAASAERPDVIFEREWKRQMFALAIAALESQCLGTQHEIRFRIFADYDLADGQHPTYAELALRHGVDATTVTNHLAWARRELRRLLAP
jgi:RNA polymerase sigma-70 factor (ECF subfamily)